MRVLTFPVRRQRLRAVTSRAPWIRAPKSVDNRLLAMAIALDVLVLFALYVFWFVLIRQG